MVTHAELPYLKTALNFIQDSQRLESFLALPVLLSCCLQQKTIEYYLLAISGRLTKSRRKQEEWQKQLDTLHAMTVSKV